MRTLIAICCAAGLAAAAPADEIANLRPIPFTAVKLEDEFWAPRIRTTIEKTIPACFDQCEKTGRIANWDKAAKKEGKFEGYFFNDSDVYKVMEAAAYAIKLDPSATYKGRKLDEYMDELIAKIAAMQQPDGYVNSYFVLTGEPKWTDIEHKHELYCAGHLIEAAVAHYQCTGKRNLLDIAIKLADHICETFGEGKGKNRNPCGHPEIELALMRLSGAMLLPNRDGESTGSAPAKFDVRRAAGYRLMSMTFLDERGNKHGRDKLWGEYAQDHKPLDEQTEVVGHAVRAMYLFSAAASDPKYVKTLDALWRDLTERKMYITGGIGNSAHNEGFTVAYDLPNENAYAETCASIGLVFWAHRMNLLHGDAKYFDVLERALYNNVLAAISLDGTSFNYVNPLASRGQHRRQPWHACACCPPNLARLFPTIGGYMYAQDEKSIYVNLYAQSTATFQHGDATVTIKQKTRYPWDGSISIEVSADKPVALGLNLRIPDWCRDPSYLVKDRQPAERKGYWHFEFQGPGTRGFGINLGMYVERTYCDPRAKSNVGRVAIQRGPLVYCIEDVEADWSLRNSYLPSTGGFFGGNVRFDKPKDAAPENQLVFETMLGGLVTIPFKLWCARPTEPPTLYQARGGLSEQPAIAIPYYAWNNREPGDMQVWIPESPAFVDPQPIAWLKPSASHCWKLDSLTALHDRLEPRESSDATIPRFTWWPKKGDEQWVQYDFNKPRTVDSVAVYWFSDAREGGGCRLPASWKLQYKKGDEWVDVQLFVYSHPSDEPDYGIDIDRFNHVSFDPVETTGLRIVAKLKDGYSAGILEWKVEEAD